MTWSNLKAMLRALPLLDFTPRTACTPKQLAGSLLIPCLIPLLLMAAVSIASLFLPISDRFRDAVFTSASFLLLAFALLNPVVHGLTFRLRVKYNLSNALLSIVVYLPIFVFATTVLMHSTSTLLDGERPFMIISWFEILLACYFGLIICMLPVLLYRVGLMAPAPAPAPAITAHRYYLRAEIALSWSIAHRHGDSLALGKLTHLESRAPRTSGPLG